VNVPQVWLACPLPIRLAALFAAGLGAGGLANWAIYTLAFDRRAISPWLRAPGGAPPRGWLDRLPIAGWWRLRRERSIWGPAFWIRPLVLEIACGVGLVALYVWETIELGLHPAWLPPNAGVQLAASVHIQFAAHAALLLFLLVATFIDFDEKTIPDLVTVPGTVVGLLFAGSASASRLPDVLRTDRGITVAPLLIDDGSSIRWLAGPLGWWLAIAVVWAWCFALLDKTCTLRRGVVRGFRYLCVSAFRRKSWIAIGPIGLLVSGFVTWRWSAGGAGWHALCAALAGLAFGGAMVWGVRAVGKWALGLEAMGFGDVTLMAMIGVTLGWQSTVVVFFLAPFCAVPIAITQWLLTGRTHIAFGPYLSLAALVLIIAWDRLWTQGASLYFSNAWFVPLLVLVCELLMGLMLRAWRRFAERFLGMEYGGRMNAER